jgi:hypothetical protein
MGGCNINRGSPRTTGVSQKKSENLLRTLKETGMPESGSLNRFGAISKGGGAVESRMNIVLFMR